MAKRETRPGDIVHFRETGNTCLYTGSHLIYLTARGRFQGKVLETTTSYDTWRSHEIICNLFDGIDWEKLVPRE